MKVGLFNFQKTALDDLRIKISEAMGSYNRTGAPQVISFTAPTGAGKTIIMANLLENIFNGDENFLDQPDAIVVWLSDSPQLNEQSKLKIDLNADKIKLSQCITVSEDSFDSEVFEDGHIYFLNTQKLSKSSKLTYYGDSRSFTIWDTLKNTVATKCDRLYFIIDEAHRGMIGRDASRATTIMQKFIKGSEDDDLPPMPVVIGMSATTQRFNKLVEGTTSTIYKSVITPDEVRSSGLLKDRIIITYPDNDSVNTDIAILQAAADDWKIKCDHWDQYCREQHYAYVNPIFIVQVLNGTAGNLTDTDLALCIEKIEERVGFKFSTGQVVHTFGQTTVPIKLNNLDILYEEPSRIAFNKKIRLVFFKENLSTGWDCPRAETMMSFKHANDATYIAQLLGRMVRTPMQMHIEVDDLLNDVHLFLPYFDENTVKDIVNELQNSEGGEIPTDIYGESFSEKKFETLTINPSDSNTHTNANTSFINLDKGESDNSNIENLLLFDNIQDKYDLFPENEKKKSSNDCTPENKSKENDDRDLIKSYNITPETVLDSEKVSCKSDSFNRYDVMKFINNSGILSYNVRTVRINDYLKSLFKMSYFLSMTDLEPNIVINIKKDIALLIHKYIETLKTNNMYENLVAQIKQFKLSTQIFDAFGKSIDNYLEHDFMTTTDVDIERQFLIAEMKLGNEGIGYAYGNQFGNIYDSTEFKLDLILFASDTEAVNELYSYAEQKFHELHDKYRRRIALIDNDRFRRQYDSIVSDGDIVSEHNFRLPETIQIPCEKDGKEYKNHLFVNETTGTAKIKLNKWEEGVIEEESSRPDFVCWIRNPARASWSLCIPYESNGEKKPTYPDFIIIRKDGMGSYIFDILEPHSPDFADNLGKAKGLAKYAQKNPEVGRIQLIRASKDISGYQRFKRLDLSKSKIRDKVIHSVSNEEIDHIFDEDGFFDNY